MHQYLGSDKEYNIYAAEIAGVELAADIALSSPTSYMKCIIYIDSQAAILGLNTPGKQSGQRNLTSAITGIQSLIDRRQMSTEIIWVPGHKDIMRRFNNCRADY